MRFKALAVFCASSTGTDPRHADAARAVGRLLAERSITVVYGGGNVGLMGAVADAALAAGGKVIGVIPRAMLEAERGHRGVTELKIVETMHERKALMADLADGFVALPGGYGTFDELFEAVTWGQLGLHGKPIGLLDAGGFYTPLARFLESVVEAGFILPRFRELIALHAEPAGLLELMARHEPPATAGWIRR